MNEAEAGAAHAGTAQEWRRHWSVVLVGMLGMALGTVHIYSTGVFLAPLEAEFDWSRSQIMFGFTLLTFVGASLAPFVGALIDRCGPRRLALAGILMYCGFLAALSLATANLYSWWGLWMLLALGGLFTKPTMWTAAVSSLFTQGRGLALAVTLCGTGLGSALVPVLSNQLIEHVGWRSSYVALAVICLVLLFPLAYLRFTSAADDARRASSTAAGRVPQPGLGAKQAILSRRFAQLALAAFCITLAIIGLVMNLVPIMSDNGLGRDTAAAIAGAVGVTSIIGRLATGYLLDRLDGNLIGGLVVLAPIVTCLCFIYAPQSVPVALFAVVVLGLALGAELDVVAYLATRHFGLRSFGVVFGCIVSLWSVATGLGPLIASYVYDVSGSYQPALWLFMPLFVVASGLLFTMGRYPEFPPVAVAEPA
ncbi:MFS transporter [Mangrovimicrobium sediminis]|uniref:MFS transporter n=1 Tax=Mangrovimicrobium sediminis TaxID=2562682 RepID=UPI001436BEF9|nr:MFS transporter [Haliea sp. SAOS-164]